MQEPGQEFGYIHFNFVVYAGLCWVLLLIWSDGFKMIYVTTIRGWKRNEELAAG